jgi:hypothetical protein
MLGKFQDSWLLLKRWTQMRSPAAVSYTDMRWHQRLFLLICKTCWMLSRMLTWSKQGHWITAHSKCWVKRFGLNTPQSSRLVIKRKIITRVSQLWNLRRFCLKRDKFCSSDSQISNLWFLWYTLQMNLEF